MNGCMKGKKSRMKKEIYQQMDGGDEAMGMN